jgi:eukaryotic-like serine/threonine-protein kinase
MADESWRKVRELFDAALQQQPKDRQNYINQACRDDKNLQTEVESLFSSLAKSDGFLETPAVAHVADLIESPATPLAAGTRFGHYEVIRQIGVGGMGEVYLAQDQKLDRLVAIKILNKKLNRDEATLHRFVREAKAASALNHPNILVIHEIGESEAAHYIVSEFIEGRTLREVLTQSQMSLVEVLDVAIQIAGALAAAHGAHLVHRDIKPENVMVRPDGYVKVLDFGLAKLVEQENKSFFGLEDATTRNQTAKGLILGTVSYMSPEQAKGEEVDERTDIFSLGVVIFEMIEGRTPFAGDSMSETFANLINAEPQALSGLAVPEELKRIIAKTLCKNKDQRYLTMKELLADLKFQHSAESELISDEIGSREVIVEAAHNVGQQTKKVHPARTTWSAELSHRKPLLWTAGVLGGVLLVGLGAWFLSRT